VIVAALATAGQAGLLKQYKLALTFETMIVGAWLADAVTVMLIQALQSQPSKALTHNWSAPEPVWKVVCANWAAVTSIA
jgi:hypothetical protein